MFRNNPYLIQKLLCDYLIFDMKKWRHTSSQIKRYAEWRQLARSDSSCLLRFKKKNYLYLLNEILKLFLSVSERSHTFEHWLNVQQCVVFLCFVSVKNIFYVFWTDTLYITFCNTFMYSVNLLHKYQIAQDPMAFWYDSHLELFSFSFSYKGHYIHRWFGYCF